jgi:transcriptional regulator with XRE-family HTH domain
MVNPACLQNQEAKMKLREIRLSQNITVPALSKASGVPVRTIEDIEKRGDCKVSTAKPLAAALGVSLDELCAVSEEKTD